MREKVDRCLFTTAARNSTMLLFLLPSAPKFPRLQDQAMPSEQLRNKKSLLATLEKEQLLKEIFTLL